MSFVREEDRANVLGALGLADVVRGLCLGQVRHPVLEYRCELPYKAYHGAGAPAGPDLVPLWECGTQVTAGWLRDNEPEFIVFSVESPDEYQVIARTEQGLLAYLFSCLSEDQDWADEQGSSAALDDAARTIGFRHLEHILGFQAEHGHKTNYPELLANHTVRIT